MKQAIITLGKFLLDNNLNFRKTAKGKGFISNNISAIQPLTDKIKELCEPCGWSMLEMTPKYNPKTNSMSSHMFYIGVIDSKDCENPEDFLLEEQ